MSKYIVPAIALFLIYHGYNLDKKVDTPVDNSTEVVVEYTEEQFPPMPASQEIQFKLAKLDSVDIDPDDALLLARAFQQWAYQVSQDERIENLTQLAAIHKGAAEELLGFHKIAPGKYSGKINAVVKDLYNLDLAFLKDADGRIKTTKLGPKDSQVRNAVRDWFNELSWKMSDIYYKNIPKKVK